MRGARSYRRIGSGPSRPARTHLPTPDPDEAGATAVGVAGDPPHAERRAHRGEPPWTPRVPGQRTPAVRLPPRGAAHLLAAPPAPDRSGLPRSGPLHLATGLPAPVRMLI